MDITICFEDDNYTYEYEIDIHDGTIENKEILVKEFFLY